MAETKEHQRKRVLMRWIDTCALCRGKENYCDICLKNIQELRTVNPQAYTKPKTIYAERE